MAYTISVKSDFRFGKTYQTLYDIKVIIINNKNIKKKKKCTDLYVADMVFFFFFDHPPVSRTVRILNFRRITIYI